MMISIAANSQTTNWYIRLDSINPKTLKAVKPDASLLKAWTSDPSGHDSDKVNGGYFPTPKNFSDSNQNFNILITYTLGKNFSIGQGSKLVIGSKDSVPTVTISIGISSMIDIAPKANLTITAANTDTLKFGSIGAGSTVKYSGNASVSQKVVAANYANLNLAGNIPLTLPSTPIGVSGVLTNNNKFVNLVGSTFVINGSGGQLINGNNYYNLTFSGVKSVPDTLRGTVGIAGTLSNTSGTDLIVATTNANTGVIAYSIISYNGFIPQVTDLPTYGNITYANGQNFYVSSFDNAGKTITLYAPNTLLQVGDKIASNATGNTISLDTSTTITAISDSVISLSNAPTVRCFVYHHTTKADSLYITSYSVTDSSITLTVPDSLIQIGDSLVSQILVAKTTFVSKVVGNVITLTSAKALTNLHILNAVAFGLANKLPSPKTIPSDVTILSNFTTNGGSATAAGTVTYKGKKQTIGGITYNNLVINQDSATTASLSAAALVKGTFTLQSGKLNTSNTGSKVLTLDVNASFPAVTNDTFFVNGPLTKNFASTTPFTYQIGAVVANICHPRKVVITPATTDPKTYTASFAWAKVGNATKIDSSTVFSIDTASNYTIKGSNYNGADSTAKITFQYSYDTAINNSLVLAQYVGGKFKSQGATKLASTASAGTITTDNYIGTFGSFAFGFNPSLLPVTFGTVSASAIGSSVKVSWQSLTEVNVTSYVVEGSADGVTFTDKGTVAAKGASEYSFVDVAPSVGVNYYRIKEVDNNGSTTYSAVVSVKESALAASLSIYPNPVSDKQLKFVLNTDAANYTLKVTNVLGQTVLAKTIAHNGGTTSYSVSLPSIKAGTYFVKLSNGANQLTKTVIVE